MTWSARLWLIAFLASLNFAAACGPKRVWPTVGSQADSGFMNRYRTVQTVDVLPLDFQVWGDGKGKMAPDAMRIALETAAQGALVGQLAERGYHVIGNMDWDGRYALGTGAAEAMSPEDVAMTAEALSSYGYAVAEANQGLLVPYLPVRLGTRTGSDATLYVGGWAYVGKDDESSTGAKVLKGVAIGAIIVLVAVVIVLVVAKGKGGGGGGGAKAAGGAARAAGGASRAGRVLAGTGRAAAGAGRAVARVGFSAARGVAPVLRGAARVGGEVFRGMWHAADALGRSSTHIHIHADGAGARPDYYQQDTTPKDGRSQMYVEMTLIDNATGAALWHARHTFPANATRPEHVNKVFQLMLATLPAQ